MMGGLAVCLVKRLEVHDTTLGITRLSLLHRLELVHARLFILFVLKILLGHLALVLHRVEICSNGLGGKMAVRMINENKKRTTEEINQSQKRKIKEEKGRKRNGDGRNQELILSLPDL